MATKVRVLLSLATAVIAMSLSGCGHYTCGTTFGNATCNGGGGGINQGGGGNGNTSTSAIAYAVNTGGTINSYTLDTTPAFGPTQGYTGPSTPTSDEGSGMVIAQKKYLYVGFPSTFQIYGFTINSGGTLTPVSQSPFSAPFLAGPVTSLYAMITNPSGTLLFVTSLTTTQVYVYQIGSGGTLTAASGSPITLPFFPANLTTDGLGKYLYVTEDYSLHSGHRIAAYSIGSTGALTAVVGSPFSYPMWQLQGDPSGKYLIGTTGDSVAFNGTDDFHLYVFGIQQSGSTAGAIAQVSGSPFTTVYSPWAIAVQPNTNGSFVYSFSINDTDTAYNPVEGFSINSSTGALSTLSGSPFSGVTPEIWGQFDQSGQFLFLYGGSSSTIMLGALDVGSGGVLTEPTSEQTLPNPAFWAVTDPQ